MKKKDLASLAVIGISAGLIVSGCEQNVSNEKGDTNNKKQPQTNSAAMHSQSDMDQFAASLSPEAKKKFTELDSHHKMMSMEMAHQSCKGQNECKGMGGCKTTKNSCAGQNGCKGEGGPPVKDPNKAVDVQYQNQMNESH